MQEADYVSVTSARRSRPYGYVATLDALGRGEEKLPRADVARIVADVTRR